MNNISRNITFLADHGCGFWRHIQPMLTVNTNASNMHIQNTFTETPILQKEYYDGMASITMQRWISPSQANLVQQFLKPVSNATQSWLIYAVDDAMHFTTIPVYNRGRTPYTDPDTQKSIKYMLNAADLVVVTTDYLKDYYHKMYDVPIENLVALPNLLPRWWFGDKYDLNKKLAQFKQFNGKPRIGIVSSLSHFNIDNYRIDKNGLACREQKDEKTGESIWVNQNKERVLFEDTQPIEDDFDQIIDCIKSTVGTFQWVLFGYAPPKVKDLIDSKKIEYHAGTPILNYASAIYNLNLQAIVSPILKNEFNFCKTYIKTMEAAAIGVPLFATNCLPYNRVMKPYQLFDNSNDLKQKLLHLKFMSSAEYQSLIEDQWKWLNSPAHEGDFDLTNYWLEDNLNIYVNMFKLRKKPIYISLNNFITAYTKKQEQEKQNIIFKTDSGMVITK